jgi:hypothetical protein
VPVHLLALLAVPLLLKLMRSSRRPAVWRRVTVLMVGVSVSLQLASIVYPSWLEESQLGEAGSGFYARQQYLGFHAGLRIENIVGSLTGNTTGWGLDRVVDGKAVGPRTTFLLPAQPMSRFPPKVAFAAHLLWWSILVATVLAVVRFLGRRRTSSTSWQADVHTS